MVSILEQQVLSLSASGFNVTGTKILPGQTVPHTLRSFARQNLRALPMYHCYRDNNGLSDTVHVLIYALALAAHKQ